MDKKNMDLSVFTSGLDVLDGKFRQRFLDKHRKLKASIHQCQYQAYSHEGLAYADAEAKARLCFLPMLLVRRHAQVLMENAKEDFYQCLTRVEAEVSAANGNMPVTDQYFQPGLDVGRKECLTSYKNTLKKNIPVVNSYYEGYLKNFSPSDGSLIQSFTEEELNKVNAGNNQSQKSSS